MTKKNFLFGAAILGGIGLAGWMGYKTFKKELKKSSKKEEQQEVIEEETETKKEVEAEEEKNNYLEPADFVADLAQRSHNEFEDDVFDIQKGLAKGAHTVHVRTMKKSLDFLLQVPVGVTGAPTMGEFTNALKEATETTWKDYVKFTEQPFGQFEAWMVLNWTDNNGVRRSGMTRVPKNIRDMFRKTNEDGAIIKEKSSFVESRCVERLNKGDSEKLQIPDVAGMKNAVFVRAILIWRISYYIGNAKYAGINLESALGCLDYLLNDFSVESREAAEFFYDHIVFYSSEWPGITVWSFEAKERGYRMLESPVVYPEKK